MYCIGQLLHCTHACSSRSRHDDTLSVCRLPARVRRALPLPLPRNPPRTMLARIAVLAPRLPVPVGHLARVNGRPAARTAQASAMPPGGRGSACPGFFPKPSPSACPHLLLPDSLYLLSSVHALLARRTAVLEPGPFADLAPWRVGSARCANARGDGPHATEVDARDLLGRARALGQRGGRWRRG